MDRKYANYGVDNRSDIIKKSTHVRVNVDMQKVNVQRLNELNVYTQLDSILYGGNIKISYIHI